MSIIYTYQKSKKKSKTKKEIAEYQAWLDGVNNMSTGFTKFKPKVINSGVPKLTTPVGRTNTNHSPSRDTGGNATLAPAKVYTGTKVKGIATMHKSNAVPVFSDEEAVEISRMRRG